MALKTGEKCVSKYLTDKAAYSEVSVPNLRKELESMEFEPEEIEAQITKAYTKKLDELNLNEAEKANRINGLSTAMNAEPKSHEEAVLEDEKKNKEEREQ